MIYRIARRCSFILVRILVRSSPSRNSRGNETGMGSDSSWLNDDRMDIEPINILPCSPSLVPTVSGRFFLLIGKLNLGFSPH